MLPGLEMMGCQNLAVPAEVMQHVVNVESSRNPYAIGVVGGQLVRQPQNLGEAVATVRMLEQKGYNYSLGVAQINRSNLGKYGLDTYEKAFDVCPNLSAGSKILAQCYASANRDWGKAFSCYYSGNFTTGYQDGYVQRIYESMAKSSLAGAQPIPLQGAKVPVKIVSTTKGTALTPDSPSYRVAMRSVLDAAASAIISPAMASDAPPSRTQPVQQVQLAQAQPSQAQQIQALQQQLALAQQAQEQQYQQYQQQAMPGARAITNPALVASPQPLPGPIPTDPATAAAMGQVGMRLPQNVGMPAQGGRIATDPATAAVMSQIGVSAASPLGNAPAGGNGVFEPRVQGPNDPPPGTQQAPAQPGVDHADLRQAPKDDAFVF